MHLSEVAYSRMIYETNPFVKNIRHHEFCKVFGQLPAKKSNQQRINKRRSCRSGVIACDNSSETRSYRIKSNGMFPVFALLGC
jgi:hypothetical protein